jgi:hypothetical protein
MVEHSAIRIAVLISKSAKGLQSAKVAMSTKYGCQDYDINRLCRFDKRAIDSFCNGCNRITDKDYLESNGLWINGISHRDKMCATINHSQTEKHHGLQKETPA